MADRLTKLKEAVPLCWKIYQHMYDVRLTNIQSRINFLLVIVSFLPLVCIGLYDYFKSPLLLFPILFQFVALIVLLTNFFIRHLGVLEFRIIKEAKELDILNQLDNNRFEADLIASLQANMNQTWTYLIKAGRIFHTAISLLLVSLFALGLATVFALLNIENVIAYTVKIAIFSAFLLQHMHFKYFKNRPKLQEFDFDEDYKECRAQVDNWLKETKI